MRRDTKSSRTDVEESRRGESYTWLLDVFPRRLALTSLVVVVACSHKPPPDFAPDPGLVGQIREIRISAPPRACPGESFAASYTAVLNDGQLIPFATRYDEDRPPRLHVVFLARTSPEAVPLENGGWSPASNPLASVSTGFRLAAGLKAKPALADSVVVEPTYECQPHAFAFQGNSGESGATGEPGPDVRVRLGIVRSPFHQRLLVAGIEVEDAPPFYVLADANVVPPADWLVIEARGGRGGRGIEGIRGAPGAPGAAGCPGSPGGRGGSGGNGGPGGPGGRDGRVTIIAPVEEPFLAGLVDGRSTGGPAGSGGRGGPGGRGGAGGTATPTDDRRCSAGANGAEGPKGNAGADGPEGRSGARPQVVTVPLRDVFGVQVPVQLAELLDRSRRRNR